jgi:glycerol-3-phosphate dehydrogenase
MNRLPSSVDLLIVGGGINGAALARLTAFKGQSVVLMEAADFGHGASSNTSKLLHGGLRYLETYDFGLVREAVRERARWLKLAPHLAEEARFHFPLVPQGRHGRWLMKCGMLLYDGMAGGEKVGRHSWVPAQTLARLEPHFMKKTGGAYAYSDCMMDDARLCLETIQDAEKLGAQVFNYHRVTHLEEVNDQVEATILDRGTGRETVVHARRAAVLAGPWTDSLMHQSLGQRTEWVRQSQGIHLIVQGELAKQCLILPVPQSTRYFFVLPHGDCTLVGTTETELKGELPESPKPQKQEIAELEALIRTYFPDCAFERIGVYAGVRPLAKAVHSSTAKLSREHVVHRIGAHIVAAVGGKYTTHRPLAQSVWQALTGEPKVDPAFWSRPLPGAWASAEEKEDLRQGLLGGRDLNPSLAMAWMQRYGKTALAVREFILSKEGGPGLEFLPGSDSVAIGEIRYAIEKEYVKTAVDFCRRRTRLYFTANAGLLALELIENRLREVLGSSGKLLGESADYRHYLGIYQHRSVAVSGVEP